MAGRSIDLQGAAPRNDQNWMSILKYHFQALSLSNNQPAIDDGIVVSSWDGKGGKNEKDPNEALNLDF